MTNNAAPTDLYVVKYTCVCGNEGEIKIKAQRGQPFVQVPELWCVQCEVAVEMDHSAPVKQEQSRILRPVCVPNIGGNHAVK